MTQEKSGLTNLLVFSLGWWCYIFRRGNTTWFTTLGASHGLYYM